MTRSPAPRTSLVLLPLLLAATACAVFQTDKDSLKQVDDLVARIERVYVECEVSNQKLREALSSLVHLTSPDFDGDAIEAHAELLVSIERSEKQALKLGNTIAPMKASAEVFFEQWNTDLESFTSVKMRERSESRLAETQARYEAILASVEPAKAALDEFNLGLRDHALYLGNDFNATSVTEIEEELEVLTELAEQLDSDFATCLAAAQDYTKSASLPDSMALSRAERESRTGSGGADSSAKP